MAQKIADGLWLELVCLLILGIVYFIVRWGVLRRPISYKEYEKWFFIVFAVSIVAVLFFWE